MTYHGGRPQVALLCDALSHHGRRRLVAYMRQSEADVFALEDLVKMNASQEGNSSEGAAPERMEKTNLHHRHLPKLDAAGIIDYDPRNRDVRYRGTPDNEPDDVATLLNAVKETADTMEQ
jgi:hypothetical protein